MANDPRRRFKENRGLRESDQADRLATASTGRQGMNVRLGCAP